MKLLAALSIFIFTLPAFADLSGHWTGKGRIGDGTEWKNNCTKISFDFLHEIDLFSVNFGEVDCGFFGSKWSPFTLEIQGNLLYSGGQQIGYVFYQK